MNALKTLSLRLRGAKVDLQEAGLETDGMAESTAKLQQKLLALTHGKVDIMLDADTFKSTTQIIREMSEAWDDMSDLESAAALELMGGKQQANVLASLIQNFDIAEKAIQTSAKSSNSALKENEKYLSSIEGKISQFTNAYQTMWNNMLGSDIVKRIVDLGTTLVKLVDQLGLVGTALVAITAIKFAPWLLQATTSFTGFGAVLSSLGKWMMTASGSSKTLGVAIANLIKLFKAGEISGGGFASGIGSLITKAPIAKFLAIAAAIMIVVKAIDHFTTSAKEAAEAAEEALTTYKNAQDTLGAHKQTIKEIKDDYEDLANGVDNLGRNVSLSTDEYERYNEITNKIASMFPEMVTGYTSEGNAIIALKGNVDALTEAYEKEAQAARDAILIKQNDVFDNFKNNTTKATFTKAAKTEQLGYLETMINNPEKANKDWNSQGTAPSVYRQIFNDLGIEYSIWSGDISDVIEKNKSQILAQYRVLKAELEAEASSIRTILNAYLEQDFDYLKLSDKGKEIAQSIISGFDTEFYSQFNSAQEMEAWVTTNVIQPLQNAGNMEKVELAFDLQTKFNNGKIPVDEYMTQIEEMLKQLEPILGKEVVTHFRTVFGIEDYETKKNSAMEITDSEGDAKVGTLSKEDLDIIDKNKTKWKEEMELDGKAEMSWEELTGKIKEAKDAAWSASEEFDKISEKIDNIQDAYSVLSDAVTQYNQNGYLTLDNLQALLSLEPEYLALLQMENGQLSINQSAMEAMIQTKLAEAKATAIQSAITQLNALAARTEADAINDSSTASTSAISGLGSYATALSGVTQEAIGAAGAVAAYNAAVKGAQANELVDQSEIDAIIANMNNQINLIDSLGANLGSNFKSIVSKDSGSSKGETALEALQKHYEQKIKNLEGQQTYIENEIEKLEAQEEGVSADYYEKQIDLEEEKIALYQQEREELLKLKRTDEVADAIWEVEHAIQESTLRMIEFRKSIAELYATASERITEAYDRRQGLSDDKTSFIENEISLRETKGELIPTSVYDDLIAEAQANRANAEAELNAQADLYWQGINNGDFEEDSDEALDILEKIRQKKLDMQEASKQEAEYIEQQKDAYIAYYDKMMEAYSYRNDFIQGQSDFAQSYIDRLGVLNINVPDEAYEKIAEIQELSAAGLREQLAFANSELAKFEAQGIDKNDPRYIEKFKEALELEKEIYDKETEVYETQQQIFDNKMDRFNQVIDRINNTTQKLQNVSGLLDREDVATEDGEWTDEGLTRLGMAYQQMEYYKQSADEVAEKMKEVEEAYENGEISEKKYYETMQELESQQWDAIDAIENQKDAIIDLNEARIDMIEQGLDKEIEAMEELIQLKRDELDAERDLFDFKKDVEKQTKDIAALERRIASMSGSSDASTIAERTKLEAQLREAKEGLDDTFYNHAMDSQSNALDDEIETFTKNSEDYLEALRESIKETDLLIETTFTEVIQNGQTVLETLTTLSNTYGFQLDGYLTAPWENATTESLNFDTYATQHFNAVYDAVNTKTFELTGYLKAPWKKGQTQAETFSKEAQRYMTQEVVEYAEKYYKQQLTDTLDYPWDQANGYTSWGDGIQGVLEQAVKDAEEAGKKIAESLNVDPPSYEGSPTNVGNPGSPSSPSGNNYIKGDKVKNLQKILNQFFGAKLSVDGSYGPATIKAVKAMQEILRKDSGSKALKVNGEYNQDTKTMMQTYLNKRNVGSWFREKGIGIPAAMYAKGTMGTTKDQWAITDEPQFGDELVLVPNKDGNLSFMRKGTSVVPADITANLVEWGKLNPNMMGIGSMTDGINLMSNYINKPEIKVDVENFLKVGTVSRDTLPELEKLMDKKIDTFAKQLNASIRKFK